MRGSGAPERPQAGAGLGHAVSHAGIAAAQQQLERVFVARDLGHALGRESRTRDDDYAAVRLVELHGDPPYDVEFTSYSKGGFSWEDQQRTAEWLSKHQGPVVLVTSDRNSRDVG
jgi:hypothetical protein